MFNWIRQHRTALLLVLIIILIITHGFFDSYFKVDTITVWLIAALLLLPHLSFIKRIKFGDFEAEITKEEVNAIKEKVAEVKVAKTKIPAQFNLQELADSDLQLALAKIRIEIEKKLRILFQVNVDSVSESLLRRMSIRGMIHELGVKKILDRDLESALTDLVILANRAIHGEDITIQNQKVLVESATKLLAKLDSLVVNQALKRKKKLAIKPTELAQYTNATYQVTTVLPYLKKPEKRLYTLNQLEFEAFLETYHHTGEVLIGMEKID